MEVRLIKLDRLTPFFRVDEKKRSAHSIYGDVGQVSAAVKPVNWEEGITMVILKEGVPIGFSLQPEGGSFLKCLKQDLEEKGITQGYFICRQGTLRDIYCSFFLSHHKPFPVFADAILMGENKINSLSGTLITTPRETENGLNMEVTPHFHVLAWNERDNSWRGGHVNDAQSGELKGMIVPLFGETLRRDVDPDTGVMYIRSDQSKGQRPKTGEAVLFTTAPKVDLISKIHEAMSACKISKATLKFAVGTLHWAKIRENEKETKLAPKYGLEILFAYGNFRIVNGKFFQNLHVGLIDIYGRFSEGSLVQGQVKDLVEGILFPIDQPINGLNA